MSREAKDRSLPFMTSYTYMKDRYALTMDRDAFVEKAYYVWREIGNIAPKRVRFDAIVGSDLVIELPDDAETVELVKIAIDKNRGNLAGTRTYSSKGENIPYNPDKNYTSITNNLGEDEDYVNGPNVTYKLEGKTLKIISQEAQNEMVTVIYNTMILDADGLPLLNDPEVKAIGTHVALQLAEQIMFRDPKAGTPLVQYLKSEADRLIQAAAIPEKVSKNMLDAVLDKRVTWDRKQYKKPLF